MYLLRARVMIYQTASYLTQHRFDSELSFSLSPPHHQNKQTNKSQPNTTTTNNNRTSHYPIMYRTLLGKFYLFLTNSY